MGSPELHGAGAVPSPASVEAVAAAATVVALPMNGAVSGSAPAGRHDSAARRRGLRKGRERGCSIYIAADELRSAGIDPSGPAPAYRIWPGRKGTVLVQLYREAS